MWDPSTIRVSASDITLFQSLGESAQRQPCFILYSSDDAGRRLPVGPGRSVMGRGLEADLRIDCAGISRSHAELHVNGETVVLRDLGSANGTHVNDVRTEGATVLRDGDMLRLGKVLLKFYARHSLDALLLDRVYRLATIDAGTDLFSKRFVHDALDREIARARQLGHPLSVICMDLDHFKSVNDRYGHNGGDVVLREAADAVLSAVRATDTVGRTGGEEFLVVLPETGLPVAVTVAERIRAAVAERVTTLQVGEPAALRTVDHRQTMSLGVAEWAPVMPDARALLGAADALLYAAKHGGRNQVRA